MKRTFLYIVVSCMVSLYSGFCLADQALDDYQVDAILKHLTNRPKMTWIASGTAKATCLKYYDVDDEPVETSETVIFDGNRYLCDIVIKESQTSVQKREISQNSIPPRYPDLNQNRHRIFCWDGEYYTRYFVSGKKASIAQTQPGNSMSYGPLSTGIVPWGYGAFTYEKLTSYDRIGWESWDNGNQQIHLQLTRSNSENPFTFKFVLDAEKDYALISYILESPLDSKIIHTYEDYVCHEGQWVPTIVTIERFRKKGTELQLASFEDVNFEMINCNLPSDESFSVKFETGTLVELRPVGSMKSLLYYATESRDISAVLQDKVKLLFCTNNENCATVAARYIAKQFSKDLPQEKIQSLIPDDTHKMTSLYELKQIIEETGLHCSSVKIDLDTLKRMKGGQAILHLSASNHYVILDHIDTKHVWYIDLINRKFYWKQPIDDFLMEWKEGTALLISDTAESIQIASTALSTEKQLEIRGGQYGNFACTELLQEGGEITCSQVGSLCGGLYYTYHERYGCEEVDIPNSTCYGTNMPGFTYYHCFNDSFDPDNCTIDPDDDFLREIRACN